MSTPKRRPAAKPVIRRPDRATREPGLPGARPPGRRRLRPRDRDQPARSAVPVHALPHGGAVRLAPVHPARSAAGGERRARADGPAARPARRRGGSVSPRAAAPARPPDPERPAPSADDVTLALDRLAAGLWLLDAVHYGELSLLFRKSEKTVGLVARVAVPYATGQPEGLARGHGAQVLGRGAPRELRRAPQAGGPAAAGGDAGPRRNLGPRPPKFQEVRWRRDAEDDRARGPREARTRTWWEALKAERTAP